MANILDVAKRAGVSPTTAKRAIRTPHLLAKETLVRVQQAVAELDYEPDQTAGGLRRGRTNTIGLMVGNIIEPFFATLTRTIAHELRARGYALIVSDNEYDHDLELQNLKTFYGHRISGLILRSAFGTPNLGYIRRMQARGCYILEIDHLYPDSPFSHVMLDGTECVRMGVRHLYELGHQRIAALGSYDPLVSPDERTKAFPQVLQSFGLPVIEVYQRVTYPSEEEAYKLTKYLMGLSQPPTAIFSLTGMEATGAFRALKELGLRIPHDVSLLTFDNYSWTSLVNPPLDVIEQPVEQMGLAAVEIVLGCIEQNTLDKVVRKRFPGKLIKRGSCAPPR